MAVEETGSIYGVVVSNRKLNLRSGASTGYAILGRNPSGVRIEILETLNGWYKTKYGGKTEYVSAEYVKVDDVDEEDEADEADIPEEEDVPEVDEDGAEVSGLQPCYLRMDVDNVEDGMMIQEALMMPGVAVQVVEE